MQLEVGRQMYDYPYCQSRIRISRIRSGCKHDSSAYHTISPGWKADYKRRRAQGGQVLVHSEEISALHILGLRDSGRWHSKYPSECFPPSQHPPLVIQYLRAHTQTKGIDAPHSGCQFLRLTAVKGYCERVLCKALRQRHYHRTYTLVYWRERISF